MNQRQWKSRHPGLDMLAAQIEYAKANLRALRKHLNESHHLTVGAAFFIGLIRNNLNMTLFFRRSEIERKEDAK